MGYLRVCGEEFQNIILTEEQYHITRKSEQSTTDKAYPEYPLAPFYLPGTIVLTHKRDTSATESIEQEVAISIEYL